MANQGREDDDRIKRLIKILKSITLSVQIAPFLFDVLYIILFILYSCSSEIARIWADTLFYVSPIVIALHLVYSKILHLCEWHKTACLIPLLPQAVSFFDYYIIELTISEAIISDVIVAIMCALFVLCAYNVFFLSNGH